MKMKRLRIGKTCGLALAVVVGIGLLMPAPLLAKFPEKPITMICPWGAGGTTDIASRVVAKHLAKVWGVNVNVVNKPGGNTVIGTMELNNSKPDGYTVMMDNRDSTSLPYVVENLPFKILDRTWMNEIAYTTYLLTVPAKSKFQNLKEIVAAVKADPKHFRVPSLGGAGTQDFFGRQFLKAIGVNYKDVSLVMGKSGGDIMIFTAQGSVDIGQVGAAAAKPSSWMPRRSGRSPSRERAERDSTGSPTSRPSRNWATRRSMPFSGSASPALRGCRSRSWTPGTTRSENWFWRIRISRPIWTRRDWNPNGETSRR